MQAHRWGILLLPAWVACSDDPPHLAPDASDPMPFTIHVVSAQAPVLVAFRDGFDTTWQAARPDTAVDVVIHGAYTIAVVCQEPGTWRTWQFAGYAGLPPGGTVTTPCAPSPARHKVTGHAARAGAVFLADASARSAVDDWSFELAVPAGTYDLIATTAPGVPLADDRIAVRRGIAVAGDLALSTPVDVDGEGVARAQIALTSDPALPADGGESLRAVVALQPAGAPAAAQLYDDVAATALVAPQAVLIGSDTQTATLEAVKTDATGKVSVRGLRRSFRAGEATTFALPPGLGDAVWRPDAVQLSVALPDKPDVDQLQVFASGTAVDGQSASYELVVGPGYLLSTSVAHLTLDTRIPDYQTAWRIDPTKPYSLSIASTRKVAAGIEIASNSRNIGSAARR